MTKTVVSQVGAWIFFILGCCLTNGHASSAGTLRDENLLVGLPDGFKLGFSASKDQRSIQEFVPESETVDDWSRMVTVQILYGVRLPDPDVDAQRMASGWSAGCPGGGGKKFGGASENGYAVSVWMFTCPLNPTTNKPENTWMKFVSGNDSFYVVQYAYRKELAPELVAPAVGYLRRVAVCDTRRPDRACPNGT